VIGYENNLLCLEFAEHEYSRTQLSTVH